MAKGRPYPWFHIPGEAKPLPEVGVPPLGDELEMALEDTAGVHPGLDFIRDGIRLLALDKLTADQTQSILSTIAGDGPDVFTALALLVQRLTNSAENPALHDLDEPQAKKVQLLGEQFAYLVAELTPREATEAAALIDGV
ncbi:hypothetical protein [Streptomyces sp. NPDC056069]|uniref:hypothetical protein n=1 Tax=Streptomyces sp. NPDC056069 TaxID=3345702 RepID=UPI0035E30923